MHLLIYIAASLNGILTVVERLHLLLNGSGLYYRNRDMGVFLKMSTGIGLKKVFDIDTRNAKTIKTISLINSLIFRMQSYVFY